MCPPPKVQSFPIIIYIYLTPFTLRYSPHPLPCVTTILLSVPMSFCLSVSCSQFDVPHMSDII